MFGVEEVQHVRSGAGATDYVGTAGYSVYFGDWNYELVCQLVIKLTFSVTFSV